MRHFLLTLIGALASVSAAAHTELSSTAPADGDELSAAPDELVLEFSEPVTLTAVRVRADDGTEHEVESLPGDESERFAVTAPELAPGRYRVEWRVLSQDTHVMSGDFAFTVEAGALR